MNKFKLITYIDRQNYLSDVFIKHYLTIFKPDEFFFLVYDQNFRAMREYFKKFGFTENNMHLITRRQFGFGENVAMQNRIKRLYLDGGHTVVYADVDELIWHPDFKNYISDSSEVHFCATGYQIVQNEGEDFLDITKPILEQRQWCQPDYHYYSKLCILKKDFTWTGGRHNKNGMKPDPSLYLVDIGKVCKKIMIENNIETTRIYGTVMERYRLITLESLEKEYKQYLKKIEKIPAILVDNKLF